MYCPANRDSMPFKELRKAHATWISATWTPASWKVAHPIVPHEVFNLPGVTILTMKADYMHCKHLGSDQYFLGSVLLYLARDVMGGNNIARNLEAILEGVKEFYQQHKVSCRFQNLSVNMFKGNSKKAVA
eukprot:12195008-Alexandrium_andersonii.AAC.1